VFDISRNGKNYFYQMNNIQNYVEENCFSKMSFKIDMPKEILSNDDLKIYLYTPTNNSDTVFIKRVSLHYIRLTKDE